MFKKIITTEDKLVDFLNEKASFLEKIVNLNEKLDDIDSMDKLFETLSINLNTKGITKYLADHDLSDGCWGVKAIEFYGDSISRSYGEYKKINNILDPQSIEFSMQETILQNKINVIQEDFQKYPDQGQVILIPIPVNEKEKFIFKIETRPGTEALNKILVEDYQAAICKILRITLDRIAAVNQRNYADKILNAVKELDILFDESGKVKQDVGMDVIRELRKTFGFSELAGYTFDLIAAKKDELSFCVDCWGQANYLSVKPGRPVPITDVKKLMVLYLQGRSSGNYSSLDRLMPRWREYLAKGYFSVIENEKGEVTMFLVNNWEGMCDESELGKELAVQLERDACNNYSYVDRNYLNQIGFIILNQDSDRLDTIMARNVLDSHKKNMFISFLPEEKNELSVFIKAMELIISKYQKKLNEINNLNQINSLIQKGYDVTRLIEHQLRVPVISLAGFGRKMKQKTDNYLEKKISEEKYYELIQRYSSILVEAGADAEYWLSIIKNLYNDVFEYNQVVFDLAQILLQKTNELNSKYSKNGVMVDFIDSQDILHKKILFYGAKNVFYSLLNNILDNAYKYTRIMRKERRLPGRSKSKIQVDLSLDNASSVFCNEQVLEISIANPGFFIEQELLDRKVADIAREISTGADIENEKILKSTGFNTNGVGLAKSVGSVLKKGGTFNMYSRPEGGVCVILRLFVNVADKEPL